MVHFTKRGGEGLAEHPVAAAQERLDAPALADALVIDCRGMRVEDATAHGAGEEGRPLLLLGSSAAHRDRILPHVPIRSSADAPVIVATFDGSAWSLRELARRLFKEMPRLSTGDATFTSAGVLKTPEVLRGWLPVEYRGSYELERLQCTPLGVACVVLKMDSRRVQLSSATTEIDLSRVVPE